MHQHWTYVSEYVYVFYLQVQSSTLHELEYVMSFISPDGEMIWSH